MSKEPLDIGAFRVVSKSVVLLDPHQEFDPENDQQLYLEKVANGRWMVLITYVESGAKAGELETMTAVQMNHIDRELDWDFDPRPIKTQSGFIALFDKDRYKKLETSFNWTLFPHGFLHRAQLGEGFYDFGMARQNDRIVGFEIFLNKVDEDDDLE